MSVQDQKVIEDIKKLSSYFPKFLTVHVVRTDEGNIHAEVTNFPGLITQASDFSELVDMLNDAVRTYFEVPEEYAAFMPNYMPPVELAVALDFMPGKDIRLNLAPISDAITN